MKYAFRFTAHAQRQLRSIDRQDAVPVDGALSAVLRVVSPGLAISRSAGGGTPLTPVGRALLLL